MPDVNATFGMPSALNSSDARTMNGGLRGSQGAKGLAKYYPSPNELERLMKEEKEKRRRMRIIQVREQAKQNAARIRHDVKNEYNKQVLLLAKKLQNEMDEEKNEKLNTLEQMYLENIGQVGQAHRDAAMKDSKADSRPFQKWENESRAQQRHRKALVKLHEETADQERTEKQHIFARQAALEQERARAFEVASRPPPPPDPVAHLQTPKVGPVKVSHAGAYSATHFHMQDPCVVERAESPEQVDAKAVAKEQQSNYEEFEKDRKRDMHEQREKARLRHKHALQKEVLKQDYNHLLHELSDLQRADAHRRSHVVAAIPRQIYQPPHRHLEEQAERQVDMERDFEDVFLAGTNYDGDLSLCLDPQPAPPTLAATESLDLSTTLIDEPEEELHSSPPPPLHLSEEAVHPDARVEASTTTDPNDVTKTMSEKLKSTDLSLKRLLQRIQKQRDHCQQSTEAQMEDVSPRSLPPPSSLPPPPSTLTPQSPVNDAASSTNGGRTLTQYSCTSSDLLARPVPSETSESTAHESLSQRTITFTESLANRGSNGALLHPMEEAARIRQKSMAENRLAVEKDRQDALKREQDGIQQEILLQQQELLALNNKIAQGRQKLIAAEPYQSPAAAVPQQHYEVSPSLGTVESLSQHMISDNSLDTNTTPPFMHAEAQTQRIQNYLDELLLKGNSIAAHNPRVSEYVNRALNQDSSSSVSVLSDKLHDPYLVELDATINELDQEQSRLSQPIVGQRSWMDASLNTSDIVSAVPIRQLQSERSVLSSFKGAESQLEQQLREAERQKDDIMARNRKHLEEIQRLKEKWEQEKEATQRLHEIIDQNVREEEEEVEEEVNPQVLTPADRPSIDRDIRTAVSLFEDVSFNSGRSEGEEPTMRSSELKTLSNNMMATDLDLTITENPPQPKVTSLVDFYDLGFCPTEQALVIEKINEGSSSVQQPEIGTNNFPSVFENTSAVSDDSNVPTWFELLKKPADSTPSTGILFKELEAHNASDNDITERPRTPSPVGDNTADNSSLRLSSTPKSFNLNNNNRDLSGASSFHFNTSDEGGLLPKQPLESLEQYKSPDTARGSNGSAGLSQHSVGAPSDSDTSFPDRRTIMDMLRKVTQRIDRQEELLDVLQRIEMEGSDLADEEKAELQQLVSERLSSLGNGSGIIEEPDITLASLNSTPNHGDDSSVMSHQHNSLLSFEEHEHSLTSNQSPTKIQEWHALPAEPVSSADSTPERAAQNAQWLIDVGTTSGRVEAISEENSSEKDLSIAVNQVKGGSEISDLSDSVAGLSLQEAFSRKRERFIKTQSERHQAAKEKVRKQIKDSAVEGNRGAMVKSISHWKKNKKVAPKAGEVCRPSQIVEKNSDDRKKAEKEAKARTERLYKRLDEVKERKQVTDRQETYAANREKAKLYHQKHRELTKKKPSKSES